MKFLGLASIALAFFSAASLSAQDISGDWQGTLNAGKELRTILKISKSEAGELKATLYSIDQTPTGMAVSSIAFHDAMLSFSIGDLGLSYHGTLSADGQSISGSLTQGKTFPLVFQRATPQTEWKIDVSPHKIQFVPVDKDVSLEVLDWGGTGRPLIFLAGLGDDAHVFDTFAPKFVSAYHVYGITRRGFGKSSAPAPDCSGNYSAHRLGDDVLAVMDALKIDRPVLVAHSFGGEELSSIGTRFPGKVAGLIYLDAGYPYAFYNDYAAEGFAVNDVVQVRNELTRLLAPSSPPGERKAIVQHLHDVSLPRLDKDFVTLQKDLQSIPAYAPSPPDTPAVRINAAMVQDEQLYTGVKVPVLAFFAVPHAVPQPPGMSEADYKARIAEDLVRTGTQADAFEAGNPTARVIRLPNANHYVFRSNEDEVIRAMNAFLARLP
ncbi:MAG: alpha/beta hydrolase [Terracidiphilus sp.]